MTKISLIKALVAGNVASVVEVLSTLDHDTLKAVRNTFNQSYTDAKVIIVEREDQAAAEVAARNAERQELVTKLMDEVNGMGLDLELASKFADETLAKKYGVEEPAKREPRYTFERVIVQVGGVDYEMPRTGNMSQALKDLVSNAGFEQSERAAFIEKFQKVTAE